MGKFRIMIAVVAGVLVITNLVQFTVLNSTKTYLDVCRDSIVETGLERSKAVALLKAEVKVWETKYQTITKMPNEKLTEFIAVFVKGRQPRISTDVARLISKAIVKYSNEYNLPPGLLIGITEAESRYNPMAFSDAKARGLMQIMFKVWGKALKINGYKELYEIDPNIKYGSRILKILLKQEGSLSKALSKYLGTTKSGKYRAQVLSTFAEFELDKHQFLNKKPITGGKKEEK